MAVYSNTTERRPIFPKQLGSSWTKSFHKNGLAEKTLSLDHLVPLTLHQVI